MAKFLVTGGAGCIGSHVVDPFVSYGLNENWSNLVKKTNHLHLVPYNPVRIGETHPIHSHASKNKVHLEGSPVVAFECGLKAKGKYDYQISEKTL